MDEMHSQEFVESSREKFEVLAYSLLEYSIELDLGYLKAEGHSSNQKQVVTRAHSRG
jgi:hypothetical protein